MAVIFLVSGSTLSIFTYKDDSSCCWVSKILHTEFIHMKTNQEYRKPLITELGYNGNDENAFLDSTDIGVYGDHGIR